MDLNKLVILLDNGHGQTTSGKVSPDKSFYEYQFNRDIVDRISMALKLNNIPYHIITPEVVQDISLTERANRVNKYCTQYGPENCLLISIHANAAGNGD
jgi:N-acetylmuramoyl-L-alanine amidase